MEKWMNGTELADELAHEDNEQVREVVDDEVIDELIDTGSSTITFSEFNEDGEEVKERTFLVEMRFSEVLDAPSPPADVDF